MLVDSHCHLNFSELMVNLPQHLQAMAANQVSHALCVATCPDNIAAVIALAQSQPNLFAAVGVHPDEKLDGFEVTAEYLLNYATQAKVVAIGETGLDYHWNKDPDMSWQQRRFSAHIEVAKQVGLPLVIHTRESAADTWQMLKDGEVEKCGAVMHCFTESLEWAAKFLDLGCYISLSGIVTFKNALQVQQLAQYIPLDRLLVETDAPYLAPVPHRGKLNNPAWVKHTAQAIADLRQLPLVELAAATTANFFNLFTKSTLCTQEL